MDESEAASQESLGNATPIFSVYRRGYDPEQVDRYVADQQRRLDEALERASESERKLAAAVGQLRELHRRVAVYESEARSAQPPQLDSLGERVQRILQEAWEGAYNLRQEAEREVNELKEETTRELQTQRDEAEQEIAELREVASREAAQLVDEATRRALALRDEMDRRRQAYLERVERDRHRAVSQITYLYDQRQQAIAELARLQATVQMTIEEMVKSPLGRPSAALTETASDPEGEDEAEKAASSELFVAEKATTDESDEIEDVEPERRPAHLSTLFGEIVEDDDVAEEESAEETQFLADWRAEEPEIEPVGATVSADVGEIPTGPMERVDLSAHTPSRARRHPAGGFYDAEADE